MAGLVVLLVDDDPDSRIVFGTILRHSGYDVVEAADGAEAFRVAAARTPHLVIMDLQMPVLDGYGAIRLLKEHAPTASVPIIALTALAWQKDRDQALAAGFD